MKIELIKALIYLWAFNYQKSEIRIRITKCQKNRGAIHKTIIAKHKLESFCDMKNKC